MATHKSTSSRGVLLLAISLAVSGCATLGPDGGPSGDSLPPVSCTTKLQPEHQLQLDAVDSLMSRSQPYAALAKLESEGLATAQHWIRRGQLLASTNQLAEAEDVFQALATNCDSAMGHHGLGLVYLKQYKFEQGVSELRKARKLRPSSPDVRNDYGYALLLTGGYHSAVFELRTAFELANGEGAVRQNLAAGYIITDDRSGLAMLRDQYDLSMDEVAHAEKLAARIRSEK
ncbi:tetratricopeptide repeat protein [Marinobacter sp. TBZ242]|uniref:Tetratricopeptide repeat protein n=1 Tax=Marinobacter azerbaijanicus TaxID=3050455 RepID=A0ABT7ICI7_9GAMM|nr:tetratricopeptide repeat protein [Marinobacter sp. TBZ242]MDL0431871.1 tetratricopeptide repeat protein [Marinobacter sp. TBZ242]